VDRLAGAEPVDLQIDITRGKPIDDNQFEAELATIVENSFNIHPAGNRFVFKHDENARSKLLSHAKNDRLFQNGEDAEHLAKEIRSVISGPEHVSQNYRVVVLQKNWSSNPWSEFEEKDQPKNWDGRLPMVVMPENPEKLEATLGTWLKTHLQEGRNTIRFLLPQRGMPNAYYDRELIVLARAVYLAQQWQAQDRVYADLARTFQKDELRPKLVKRFERFAVLCEWNYAEPAKCLFEERSHGAQGDKIPEAMDRLIRDEVFIPEEFEDYVFKLSESGESIGKLLRDLKEPRPGGKPCIPWLGEVSVKERVIKLCASGQIAINVRGLELLQARPGESEDNAWNRMKGRVGTGKHLDETTMHLPNAVVTSGGKTPTVTLPETGPGNSGGPSLFPTGATTPPGSVTPTQPTGNTNLFGGQTGEIPATRIPCSAPATSSLNLLGQIESWGIGPAVNVNNVAIKVGKMTGSQLQQLLKHLPDGVTYSLDLEKEGQ
jgi:hypothetical protein